MSDHSLSRAASPASLPRPQRRFSVTLLVVSTVTLLLSALGAVMAGGAWMFGLSAVPDGMFLMAVMLRALTVPAGVTLLLSVATLAWVSFRYHTVPLCLGLASLACHAPIAAGLIYLEIMR